MFSGLYAFFSDFNSMVTIKQRVKEAGGVDSLKKLQRHEQEWIKEVAEEIPASFPTWKTIPKKRKKPIPGSILGEEQLQRRQQECIKEAAEKILGEFFNEEEGPEGSNTSK